MKKGATPETSDLLIGFIDGRLQRFYRRRLSKARRSVGIGPRPGPERAPPIELV
jgi:hypothetical protein